MAAFRYALRGLRRNPGFALTALATLALGIGATTLMFTLVNAVALRPLPYPEAARLVWISQLLKFSTTDQVTVPPDFLDWRRLNHTFDRLAAYLLVRRNLTGTSEPLQVMTARASADFLPALGVNPIRGRNFERAE